LDTTPYHKLYKLKSNRFIILNGEIRNDVDRQISSGVDKKKCINIIFGKNLSNYDKTSDEVWS